MAAKKNETGESGLKVARCRLVGTSPLLLHNSQLANPFNKYARELSRLNREKRTINKTDEDAVQAHLTRMSEVEWRGGMYYDAKLGPFLPSSHVQAALTHAARLERMGKDVERGVFPTHMGFKLDYVGPRDLDAMWESGQFTDIRVVDVMGSKIARTRPVFNDWSVTVEFRFLASEISSDLISRFITSAGQLIGVGDGRSIQFGRFAVENLKFS